MTLEKKDVILETISIRTLKHHFVKEYPSSPINSYLQSLPDTIPAEELIGATAILLAILDATHNNLELQIKKRRWNE
jgi:hypothetical protein